MWYENVRFEDNVTDACSIRRAEWRFMSMKERIIDAFLRNVAHSSREKVRKRESSW
ncbi:hypothetical protein KSX_92910 [Ktedonospora formicarum]|uniref:Uncharacterized protein n=1 Tax=Ktedonospora formicarum TaxID=2778364 RepID=A0A8J3IBW3_9CHLR|nr:hypothetical protein KSX_92910 [Ktedonospora formicarum]